MLSFSRPLLAAVAAAGLLAAGPGRVLAQQAPATIRLLPEDAQRGSNGHQQNFYFLPPGVGGENYQSAGFFGGGLRPYLAGNAEATGNLNNYRRQKALFLADRLLAVGAVVTYGVQVFEKPERQYASTTQLVAGGVFATSLLATVFINRNTNRHFQRAVSAANAGKAQGGLGPRLRPAAVGLGAVQGRPVLAVGWALR